MPTFKNDEWLALVQTPLNVSDAVAFVTCPEAGGIDLFLGTTRGEGDLIALDYEAYESMAIAQLQDLSERAGANYPVKKLVILHRLGRVAIGEASVLIAVSTPHRADAFACCRWIIDELKKEVTIWKKEIWASRDSTWVHPDPSAQ